MDKNFDNIFFTINSMGATDFFLHSQFFFPALSCGGGGSHLVMSDSLHPHGL